MSESGHEEPMLTTDFIAPSSPALDLPNTDPLSADRPSADKANLSGTEQAASSDDLPVTLKKPFESDASFAVRENGSSESLDNLTQSFDNSSALQANGTQATNLACGGGQGEVVAATVKPRAKREIAGYTLLGVLGRGGMGVVYKARQEALSRVVAVKMLLAGGHASGGQLRRFVAEGRAVAKLKHPNIVQIFDVGAQDGLHYLAMELVEGGSLEKLVQGTPQPVIAASGLVESLAWAIQHAHEQGIVHRDLKPANILLQHKATATNRPREQSDATEQPPLTDFDAKIADFGLAKFLDDEEGQTRTGTVAGTPSYMSPEQASGKTKETGPETDIYALGAILYKLLTGRPPFYADTAIDTLNQVVADDPVAPTRLQPKVPRDLETICLKCLTKEKHKRYRRARELAEDLRRFQQAEPIAARRTPIWERVWKWARRRPAVATLTALLAIVTCSGVGLVTEQWLRAEDEREKAELSADREAKLRVREEQQRIEAQRVSAGLLRERGLAFCQQGEYGRGSLWLARALTHVPAEAKDLDDSIRTLLGASSGLISRVSMFYPHPVDVMAAALSPDGRTVATGGMDGKLRLWDAATGQLRGDPLQSGLGAVQVLVYSPDGRFLLTGSGGGTVSLWRTADSTMRWQKQVHQARVQAAGFSADGQRIGTGGFDGTVRLWETATGQLLGQPLRHQGRVTGLTFTPDGNRLLTASLDRTVRQWDVKTSQEAGKPWQLHHEVSTLALSPNGKLVATGELDGNASYLRLWDAVTGKPIEEKRWSASLVVGGVVGSFSNLAFSPDGQCLLTGSTDGTAQLWSTRDLRPLGEPLRHQKDQEITSVAFRTDGRMVLTSGRDGTARLWDTSALLTPGALSRQNERVRGIYFSPDGAKLLTLSGNVGLLLDANTARSTVPPLRHESSVGCAAFSPDGRIAALGDDKGTVRLWDTTTGQPRGKEMPHPDGVVFVVYHPKGELIVTGCRDHCVRFWDAATGQILGEPTAHEDTLQDRAYFSPDGGTLALLAGSSARLWRVATRTALGAPLKHDSVISAAAFSPDGKFLATASFDKTVRFWDAATAASLDGTSPHGEPDPLMDVVFSPSGETILTRGGQSVRLWSSRSWQPIAELRHSSPVMVSSFSRDGRMVLTGGIDRTIRLWDARTGQPLGEPLAHGGNVFLANFRPDSRLLASVQFEEAGDLVRLWPVAPPMHGETAGIALRLQVDTSLELDAAGAPSWLPLTVWKQRFLELSPP